MKKYQKGLEEFFQRCLEFNEQDLTREEELTLAEDLKIVAKKLEQEDYNNILEY